MKRIALLLFLIIQVSMLKAQAIRDSIRYENLIFEGAGIRGLAYCGALMEMEDR